MGIDFGTSTSVVSIAIPGLNGEGTILQPVPIPQQLADGRQSAHHLVPTMIAWHEGELLVGAGARELRGTSRLGTDHWASFKMQLGVDLGPVYFSSALGPGHTAGTITNPREAATVFLKYVLGHLRTWLQDQGHPSDIQLSVSIPASFEANQRQDLLMALQAAGADLPTQAFIDEPNAAFLSYLFEYHSTDAANSPGGSRLTVPTEKPLHVLVFDFGAGTCDISILEIGQEQGRLYSKNLAVSRFEALGGDDIDRAIARQILLPQLCSQNDIRPEDLTSAELDKRLIPALLRPAEELKIRVAKHVASERVGRGLPKAAQSAHQFVLNQRLTFPLPKRALTLEAPSLSPAELNAVMEPFLRAAGKPDQSANASVPVGIFDLIESALRKAELGKEALDFVLLIGGSAENPYVQSALHEYFGRTDIEVPRDLRAHVSAGAALHSLLLNGLGVNLIKPITSEPIFAMLRDGEMQQLVRAGQAMPYQSPLPIELRVSKDGQEHIQIPIAVGQRDKILAVIDLQSASGFPKGTSVRLTCALTDDKLLHVEAEIDGLPIQVVQVNPFANRELTTEERMVLEAEKKSNQQAASNNGRPTAASLDELADAYQQAKRWLKAAETAELAYSLKPVKPDNAETHLCWLFSKADRPKQSMHWAEKAHQRSPSATTAFNLALDYHRRGDTEGYERLMEESLTLNGDAFATLDSYGRHLLASDPERGRPMVERAVKYYKRQLEAGRLAENDIPRLKHGAKALGQDTVVAAVEAYRRQLESKSPYYDAEKLLDRRDDEIALVH